MTQGSFTGNDMPQNMHSRELMPTLSARKGIIFRLDILKSIWKNIMILDMDFAKNTDTEELLQRQAKLL